MSPQKDSTERLEELAELLAMGLTRAMRPKSRELSSDPGESSLDILGHRSGHPTAGTTENGR